MRAHVRCSLSRLDGALDIDLSPRARMVALVSLIGEMRVAGWCAGLLGGSIAVDDANEPSLGWLGGRHASSLQRAPGSKEWEYWPRVWAARGLLYAWSPDASSAVIGGLRDSAWRVREMSARVTRARELEGSETALEALAADPIPRVRAAALLALGRVGEVEHGRLVARHLDDRELAVRRAAVRALAELSRRLDHKFGR